MTTSSCENSIFGLGGQGGEGVRKGPASATCWVNAPRAIPLLTSTKANNNSICIRFLVKNVMQKKTFGVSGSRVIPHLTSSKGNTKLREGPNSPPPKKKQIREGRAKTEKERPNPRDGPNKNKSDNSIFSSIFFSVPHFLLLLCSFFFIFLNLTTCFYIFHFS